ncbi:YbhN family protein [Actinomadura kijaniata]|uniref:Integral membrane protein n=1 Tax=Actinomadura namibiensis TaxID=182080 RepID=A0A7W3QK38_ACTNM|nr:lysylphosphatidylglycerol synthase transmembrane domain-containing protein [Actinomadura namibiensis]MBA8949573.1 hypothetical protein [Actinomadura namibiensis]
MAQTITAPSHDPSPDLPTGLPTDPGGPPVAAPRRSRRSLLLQAALFAATVALLVVFRDQLPDLGAMLDAAVRADPAWLVLVVLASGASMGAFARLQRRLLRIGGTRIRLRRAFAITYAGNALSVTLPAGPAVSVVYTFQQFRRNGASARLATAVLLLGGVITTAAYTLIGLLALLAEPNARGPALRVLAVCAALGAALVVALRHPGPRALAGRPVRALLGHPRIAPHADRLRGVRQVLRPTRRDWGALALLATANWVFDILALLAAAQSVGIDVAPHGVALAYFAAQAAASLLPLLPGGLGAVEGSMAASLAAFGATLTPAAAAVGLYRLASYWIVVAIGWLAWLALHEGPRISARTRRRLHDAALATLHGMALATAPMVVPTTSAGGRAEPGGP